MKILSSAFADTALMPKKYTGDGEDMSPPLEIIEVTHDAKSIAIICDDPDAPRPTPFVHWVVFNLPHNLLDIAENASKSGHLDKAIQGKNDMGNNHYNGPMPPKGHGRHHYHFKAYALDTMLDLAKGTTKDELIKAMKGHILDQAELVGEYER